MQKGLRKNQRASKKNRRVPGKNRKKLRKNLKQCCQTGNQRILEQSWMNQKEMMRVKNW